MCRHEPGPWFSASPPRKAYLWLRYRAPYVVAFPYFASRYLWGYYVHPDKSAAADQRRALVGPSLILPILWRYEHRKTGRWYRVIRDEPVEASG